jgi:hypothetical protein
MKRIIYIIGLLPCLVFGQKHLAITGTVRDEGSGLALSRANVSLLGSNAALQRKSSGKDGKFEFSNIEAGTYRLIIAYIGYETDTLQLTLKEDTLLQVHLKNSSRRLAEVMIKAVVPPVSIRRDTISYNAEAYPSRPYASVEDLLRKLPGIEVDQDGNVTMNGQPVDRLLIDGKTFFIDDLRKATQNLPAGIVAQVEVYDSRSDAAKQAGITEHTGTKTINLKLKSKDKVGVFGRVYAGAGTGGGYAAGGNLTGIGPRLFAANVSNNNINNQFNGSENNYAQARPGKQQAATVNLNYKQELDSTLTFNGYANLVQNQQTQQNNKYRQTFLTDSTLQQQDKGASTNSGINYNLGASLEYKPGKHTYISYRLNYMPATGTQSSFDSTLVQVQKTAMLYTGSSGSSTNSTNQHGTTLNNNLNFSHGFDKAGRALLLSAGQSLNNQNQQQDLYTLVQSSGPAQLVNQHSTNPTTQRNYFAGAAYSEPLSKKLGLLLDYHWQVSDNRSVKSSDDYDPATTTYDLPDTLTSNSFNNKVTTSRVQAHLSYDDKKKLAIDLAMGGQNSLHQDDNQTSGLERMRTFNSLLPEAYLRYSLSQGEDLDVRYNGASRDPTIEQLQPLPNLGNPYLVQVGNANLRQAFRHNVFARFVNFNAENFRSLQLSLNADETQHPIGSAVTGLPSGVQVLQFVNLADVYHLNATATCGFPLFDHSHGTGSISSGLIYGHDNTIVNGLPNADNSTGLNGKLNLNFHEGDRFFIESGASLSLLVNHYSLQTENGGQTLQEDFHANAYVALPFSLIAGAYCDYRLHSASGLPGLHSTLLNAYLGKDLAANHSVQLQLSAFNLLNQAASLSEGAGPNYIETQQSYTRPLLLLLSLVYHFKKFNAGTNEYVK